jgi:LysR family glycine cleavage system transcriptional activator
MARPIPPLNALRAFETAARHRSLSKAAAELVVSQAAVSRHVKTLEGYLGVTLFERKPSSLQLTAIGKAYAQRLTRAFAEIAGATEQARTVSGKQWLSLRAYSTFMLRWLLPRLPDFQLRYPAIDLKITTGADAPDFSRDAMDVAIRYGRGNWPGLHARRIFSDALQPFCTPAYAERMRQRPGSRAGGPITLENLSRCTLLHHSRRSADWPDWLELAGVPGLSSESNMVFDDLLLTHEAVLRGLGVGITQQKYIEAEVRAGIVVCPFDIVLRRDVGYYVVCRTEAVRQPGLAAFLDWVEEAAAEGDPPALTVAVPRPRRSRTT